MTGSPSRKHTAHEVRLEHMCEFVCCSALSATGSQARCCGVNAAGSDGGESRVVGHQRDVGWTSAYTHTPGARRPTRESLTVGRPGFEAGMVRDRRHR